MPRIRWSSPASCAPTWGGSGVKKCNGPDGVATQSTGAKVFVVKATDEVGNDSATTIHYVVAS